MIHVICDVCKISKALPSLDDFERRGWTFTKPRGVRCPACVLGLGSQEQRKIPGDEAIRALFDAFMTLRFYADAVNWLATGPQNDMDPAPAVQDHGHAAHQALIGLEEAGVTVEKDRLIVRRTHQAATLGTQP